MSFRAQFDAWLLLLILAVVSSCSDGPPLGTAGQVSDSGVEVAGVPNEDPSAEAMFEAHCAGCHSDPENKRAPEPRTLARLNIAHIAFAMTNGTMKPHAEDLEISQIFEVADFISDVKAPYEPNPDNFCADKTINTQPLIGRWGIDKQNSGLVPEGVSTIFSDNVGRLELAWAFGLPDVANARSQPVVTRDTLFIAATSGHLFALDRTDGCIKWHSSFPAAPRTALTLGTIHKPDDVAASVLFFGDVEAHTVAVDALTGELIWRVDAAVSEHSFLTGAVVQHEQQLIVPVSLIEVVLAGDPEYQCCKSHGAVLALDANTGARLWTTELTEPATLQGATKVGTKSYGSSGVPVWSTPTIDAKRGRVYIGTGQNASQPVTDYSDAVLALDLATGEVVWHFQAIAGDAYNGACEQQPPGPNCPKWPGPDHDIGASIILTRDREGNDILLVGQKSGDVYALDPDNGGRMIWQQKVGAGSFLGGVHWGIAHAGHKVFVPISDPAFPRPGYFPKPGLYALDTSDGDEVWAAPVDRGCDMNLFDYFSRVALYPDCSFYFGLSAAPLAVNDLVFAPALDGKVRAFSMADGEILWSYDTLRPFETINGIEAHGGSIDVAGVQTAGDMLYVQSGYGTFGQLPGNALLAFRLCRSGCSD